MSILLSAVQIAKTHGSRELFRNLSFSLGKGQKIGLIGPNGAGKSTLLRLLVGQDKVDAGQIHKAVGLRIGFLEQNPTFTSDETIFEAISEATGDSSDASNLRLTYELMAKLDLDGPSAGTERKVSELSGGWQKRVALARELARKPDLLLLDEPTNHLDVPSIQWVEEFLESRQDLALLCVTHDRMFLQNTCDAIFDLDRRNPEGLIQFTGTYADFAEVKESLIDAQRRLESTRRNTLRRETEWLRRGAKARQTKQKARIERAGDLKEEVQNLAAKNADKLVQIDFGDVGRSPKKLLEAKNLGKRDGDRWLFRNFDFTVGAKARIGLLGANGCGKTTLLRTLLEELKPDEGSVLKADNVSFATFEQRKESLQPGMTVLKSLLPEGDYVQAQGQPVFARSYLARFHFRPEQMDMPVEKLSGGEQTRLLLARLMLKSDPVLVLDEPTNDLDLETLETLQQALTDFPGVVLLVTHDRYFMGQIAKEILAFDGNGGIERFADLFQWEDWQQEQKAKAKTAAAEASKATTKAKSKRLSYKDQLEFDRMEATIETAENKLSELHRQLTLPEHQSHFSKLQELTAGLQQQQQEIDKLYARWQELSALQGIQS